MPFFYNLFLAIIFIPAMILCGCSSSSGHDATPDAGPVNIDAKDFSADSLPSGQYIVHLKLQTPDGKPATWLVCYKSCELDRRDNEDHVGYWNEQAAKWKPASPAVEFRDENVSQISHNIHLLFGGTLELEIALIRDNYMFVEFLIETDMEMLGSQKEITPIHEWTAGTWGLAPYGNYESEDGKRKKTLLTVVPDKIVRVSMQTTGYGGLGDTFPLSSYNSWFVDTENFMSKGTMADDLSSITYYEKYKFSGAEVNSTIFKK